MNRNTEVINGEPVAVILGPETKLFFKRYAALKTSGAFGDTDHAKKFSKLRGDKEAFSKQVEAVVEQAVVSKDVAISGTLFVRANQQTPFFDPLTLPWLN